MGKRLWRLHSLLGLIGGLFLLAIGLSGSALVFADELDALLHPQLRRVTPPPAAPLDFDRIHAAVRERWPDAWGVRFRRLPRAPGETVQMSINRNSDRMAGDWFHVYVHPHTAEILGWKHALGGYGFAHNPVDWLLWFHYSLHAGKTGESIVALMSLVLLGSASTGAWIYRRQFWRGLFFRVRIRESSSRKRWSGLHGVIGAWSLLLNLVLGTTGFWMTRHVWSAEHLLAPKPVAEIHAPTPAPAVSYNAAMAGLKRELPDFLPEGLSAISSATDDYRIYGRLHSEPLILGSYASEITIDGTTGRIKTKSFISQKPLTEQLSAATIPLHFGNFGGWPVKLLWCVGGLAPGMLALSGILIWQARRSRPGPTAGN
ncbi:MAG TPA: PepSY-associated TM helix domain-containing protein [Chthoniobacterales bacterium]|jgi:uncharacterized iron-regulated membrane protein